MAESVASHTHDRAGGMGAVSAEAGVSLLRLYLLRVAYLLFSVGLALTVWPTLPTEASSLPLMTGVVRSILAAFSIFFALGIRYPLPMLPVMLFELVWKTIWLLVVALPLWRAGAMDERTLQTALECLAGVVIIPIVLPWGYVFRKYVSEPGQRWK